MSKIQKSGKCLYDYLSSRVYKGKLNIPQSALITMPKKMFVCNHQGISSNIVLQSDIEGNKLLKEQAWKFYSEGPLPRAMGMDKAKPGDKLFDYLNQELDLMVNSNVSQLLTDQATGEFVGLFLNFIWRVDPTYDAFPVNSVEWLNIAGKVANDVANSDDEAVAIWRDFQQQLIHHLYQGHAQKQGKEIICNVFAGKVEKNYQNRNLVIKTIGSMIQAKPENTMLAFFSTLPQAREAIPKYFSKTMTELAFVPYAEMTFQRNGKAFFEQMVDRKGMSFNGSLS